MTESFELPRFARNDDGGVYTYRDDESKRPSDDEKLE